MAVVILKKKLTKKGLKEALKDYGNYIKITVDIKQEVVSAGGVYHAQAEEILLRDFRSGQEDIVGGGLDIKTGSFDVIAMINLRPFSDNMSMEMLDEKKRERFLKIVKKFFKNYRNLL